MKEIQGKWHRDISSIGAALHSGDAAPTLPSVMNSRLFN
jgi:hypothetical protein